MKKFILGILFTLIGVISVSAQNYAGSSKFTDNWSVTMQGGVLTTYNNFFTGHTATAPIIAVGIDKYVTPWLGFGVEGRTLVGTGHGSYNTHTAFDAVNVSGYGKVNLVNLFKFNGTRRMFEPVVYTGIGWGHQTAHAHNNYLTYRAGTELNFNIGKNKAWAIVVNPSVVWGNNVNDVHGGANLCKNTGNFEITTGFVYHFKTSNGKHSFTKARLYDDTVVANLSEQVSNLTNALSEKPKVVEETKIVNKIVVEGIDNSYSVYFSKGSSEIGDLTEIAHMLKHTNYPITITGSASPEGSETFNKKLALDRANAVKDALVKAGIDASRITISNDYDKLRRVTITTEN